MQANNESVAKPLRRREFDCSFGTCRTKFSWKDHVRVSLNSSPCCE